MATKPILIADDAPENVYLLSTLLKGHGYTVQEATNGQEALKMARQSPPGMIITDILMPVMDGFQLCREWKASPMLASIPFVFYTATYTDAADEKYALSLGAERFLRKPLEPDKIIEVISELLFAETPGTSFSPNQSTGDRDYADVVFRKLEKKVKELEAAKSELELEITQREAVEAQRRELEAQLRHAQKMEALGTMASGLTHDFNNILSAIIGCAEVLEETLRDTALSRPKREKSDRLLHVIIDASNKGSKLIKQILTVSRSSEQEMRLQSPYQTVSDALALLKVSLPPSTEIKEALNPECMHIVMDSSQIHQVVMNLCINASHAMPQGGTLGVSLDNVDLPLTAAESIPYLYPGSYVLLRVSDTGTGISKENLARIFEPYFTTKKATEGTGLGLSVVKGIVKNHNAILHVDSELNRGTDFSIYFLPEETQASSIGAADSYSLPLKTTVLSGTVLLVDSLKEHVSIEASRLESMGLHVISAVGRLEAIEVFKKRSTEIDLVIFNQQSPQCSGLPLVESLKEVRGNIPVIIYATAVSANFMREASLAGVSLVLGKPFSSKRCAAAIGRVLSDAK